MNNKKTILIVDDSRFNIKMLSDILKDKLYNIVIAESGEEALEIVEVNKPDLILLDIMMPEIDGFKVCRRLKQNEQTASIPIIFISGLDKSSDIVKGFQVGAVDYIVKPFQKEVVLARVNTHLKLNETQNKLKKTNDELKNLLKEVKYLSFHDEMTGLYNRRYFENEMSRLAGSRELPITILISDLDNLKKINDNYGHDLGDTYIKAAASILENSIRAEDIAARIGGDEFAVILSGSGCEAAKAIKSRIKKNIENYNKKNNLAANLEISIGYAVKTEVEEDITTLFKRADQMMYDDKNN